ncbi:MAG: phosphoribosyl-ATP diphosphatase, partial [Thermoleophilaceae bacterium]|nr:phosphoribosyl-ATP diphosphatase [Thermoleophilaceae bacterium]
LPELERTLAQRKADRPAGSYVVTLLDDPSLVVAKVMEEAEEVTRAAREESDERVDEEAADVLFHLMALLQGRGHSLGGAQDVLRDRRKS